MLIQVDAWRCRCGHTWLCVDQENPPKQCAKCRRRDWNDGEVGAAVGNVTRENVTASVERVKMVLGKKSVETTEAKVEEVRGPVYDFSVREDN